MKKSKLNVRIIKSQIFDYLIKILSLLMVIPLVCILFYVLKKGISVINWTFFTALPKPVGELGGGVSNAIVGSLSLVIIAAGISLPLGILIGVFLAEHKDWRLTKYVQLSIDTLQGIPSIVIGIIAYAWIVVPSGSFSVFSGGIALALIMLPIVAKATEETLSLIPDTIKEASYALGVPYYKTILKVVIPSAKQGILSGALLAIARVIGETAPLLFTAFGNPFMNINIMNPSNALPLLIFNYATSPYEDWQNLAWGASLILIFFVLFLSIISKKVGQK